MNKVKNTRLLMWNDDSTHASHWKLTAINEGFRDTKVVSVLDVSSFVEEFLRFEPDVVVLDIMHGEKTLGLDLAKAIRQEDTLVPIIAFTARPDLVFKTGYSLDDYSFCGIYPGTVFEDAGGLLGTTIRQALNNWHAQVPEFALARSVMHGLRRAFDGAPEGAVGPQLRKLMMRLPHSGSMDAWHKLLTSDLESMLTKRGHSIIAGKFRELSLLFQRADPFYMAGSSSRKHLSHNVQVFLLGCAVLLANIDFQSVVISGLRTYANTKTSALELALLIWACASLTHDTAYLSQGMRDAFKALCDIATRFGIAVGVEVQSSKMEECPLAAWPRSHHAEVASNYWLRGSEECEATQGAAIKMIADAILRHDSNYAKGQALGPALEKDWAKFLIVLCDELQDWLRLRETSAPGIEAPWRRFVLEIVRVSADTELDQTTVHLGFVLQDHPSVVADQVGKQGTDSVKRRFQSIIQVLQDNLRGSKVWNVMLSAEIASRAVDNVVENEALPCVPS